MEYRFYDSLKSYQYDKDRTPNTFPVIYDEEIWQVPPLYAAALYDKMYHPDETVFVTFDKLVAEEANVIFGEDSIILLGE